MKIIINKTAWDLELERLLKNTNNPVALKRRDIDPIKADITSICFGYISEPTIKLGDVSSDDDLYRKVRESGAKEVIVVGKGWMDTNAEKFVWIGTVDEFEEMWKGD